MASVSAFAQNETVKGSALTSGITSQTGPTFLLEGTFGQPVVEGGVTASEELRSGFYSGLLLFFGTNLPPTITHTPALSFQDDPVIQATIKDIDGISLTAVHYSPIASQTFAETAMTRQGTTDQYTVSVSSAGYDEMGIHYYFTAEDNTGKSSRSPLDEDAFYYSYQTNPEAIVPGSVLKYGQKSADYRAVAMPYTFTTTTVQNVFSSLTGLDNTKKDKWRLYAYGGDDSFPEYPAFTTIERGKAYFLLISDKDPVDVSFGSRTAPSNNQSALFGMTLSPGWNLVGNPYTVPVSWENVRAYNDDINIKSLKIYTGNYSTGDILAPFQGGFVYLEGSSPAPIKIPFSGQTSGGRVNRQHFDSDLSSAAWKVDLSVEAGVAGSTIGSFGMHPDASLQSDYFDDYNPPRFFEYTEINFPHPEHVPKSFSDDIVTSRDDYAWDFSVVSSQEGMAELQWDNTGFGDNGNNLYLYDRTNTRLIDMRTRNHYPFDLSDNMFKIYFGKDLPGDIGPERAGLSDVYPNPSKGETTIPFALPGHEETFRLRMDIIDARGERVRGLIDGEMKSGFHEVNWDGTSDGANPCAQGLYFCRLVVFQDNGPRSFTNRILIIK